MGPFLNLLQECYKRHFELKNRVRFNCFLLIIRLEIGGVTTILGGRLRGVFIFHWIRIHRAVTCIVVSFGLVKGHCVEFQLEASG